ncbi:TolC family outer membrane protein [Paraburkholderia kirstenboschensis]|uniref:TolC family outer membrane protein n=1 Tax=Paraburkholderia kirstenboschensis TaxID=1245436 RepID=A0ABZ0EPU2_9BURK|nr:TolC family outer membrane protein [Paraburkholderia kirstenboschensis]WOD19186.1 TolC family outer membrane protein [Paraburkholderia kirstenboschensis]
MNKRTMAGALLVFTGVAYAGAAAAVDLLTVVEQSTDRDADLAAFRAGSRAAGEAVPKARAALLPQLEAGWGRAYNSTVTEGLPNTHYWQNGWTVALTQPVFDWSRWTTYKQADFVQARGAVDLARAQQSAILRAVQTYFDELAAEDELTRANDYTAALDVHLDELRRRRRAGEATVIDVQEAEAAREQAQSQQLDARDDLQLKRLALEHITGQRFAGLSRLSDAAVMPGLHPDDVESWASQAEAHDYTVQLKQIDRRIAELEVEKARAARLPVVNLTASHTPAGAASGYIRPTTTTTAMLSVSIPIFEGGATSANIDEKLALEDRAQDELVAATRLAGASAREYWSRFLAGVARIEALSRLVQSSRAALNATQVGYRVGSRGSTDVLRASDSFFANRRDLIRARYATIVGLLQLKAATASLNLDEVARVNELVLNGEDRQAVAHVDAQHAAVDAKVERAAVGAKMGRPAVGTEMPRALVRAEPPQGVILTDLHPAAIDAAVQRALASIHQQ